MGEHAASGWAADCVRTLQCKTSEMRPGCNHLQAAATSELGRRACAPRRTKALLWLFVAALVIQPCFSKHALSVAGAAHSSSARILQLASANATHGLSYSQLYHWVNGMLGEVAQPEHSWGVEWQLLAGSEEAVARRGIKQAMTAGPLLKQVTTCMNGIGDTGSYHPATYDNIVAGDLPNITVVAGWWASEQQPRIPATVVTFANMQRIEQLAAQCLAWPGPLSAVLYQPLLQESADVLSTENRELLRKAVLRAMHLVSSMERLEGACQLNLLVVYEVIQDKQAMHLLPLNTIRNLARMQVRTPLSVLLDVDLLPSRTLYERLADPQQAHQLVLRAMMKRELFIMPAFELAHAFDNVEWADKLVRSGDTELVRSMAEANDLVQFQKKQYRTGHHMTNYRKWHSASQDYSVRYQEGAEPWVIGPSQLMPWSDERYRGYGRDKIQLLNTMSRWNYSVLHDVYLIHRPHPKATTMLKHTKAKFTRKQSFHEVLEYMYFEQLKMFKQRQDKGWKPPINQQLRRCLSKLPWWSSVAA